MNIKELKRHLEHYDDGTECAYSLWLPTDVMLLEVGVTQEQAEEVLHRVDDNFDASCGISWDTLEYYLDQVKREGIK